MDAEKQDNAHDRDEKSRSERTLTFVIKKLMFYILFILIGTYLTAAVVLFVIQRSIFYPREHLPTQTPEIHRQNAEVTRHKVDGGEAIAIWMPSEKLDASGKAPLMLYFHGNGSAAQYVWPMLEPYRQMGMHILVVEYPGYAGVAGEPTQETLVQNAVFWREKIAAREDVDTSRIVYFGTSLGGGVACALAATHPPKAFILRSTFSSMREMASTRLMPGFLVRDPYESLQVLNTLPEVPVLLTHGTKDLLIPLSHAKRIAASRENIEFYTYPCGHNDCPRDSAEVRAQRRDFLIKHGILPTM
jgi:pimeloyl-ACP methyl ester carboxylesterase